jgi:putative transposase
MARIPRIVIPHHPHHVVQRGNRRQEVFFKDEDYREYLNFLEKYSKKFKLKIVSYCLMPNHTHLIVIPEEENSLAQAIGETHRNYTRMINFRENWRGYLWQGRFSSYVLDERYLYNAVKYILLNPVRAKMVKKAQDYKYSSLGHHLNKKKSAFLTDDILHDIIKDWTEYLQQDIAKADAAMMQKHERTGRPLGSGNFIKSLERKLGLKLRKKKPGPKPKKNS